MCANLTLLLAYHIRNSKPLFFFLSPITNRSACGVRKIRTLWRTKTKTNTTEAYKSNFIQDCRATVSPSFSYTSILGSSESKCGNQLVCLPVSDAQS